MGEPLFSRAPSDFGLLMPDASFTRTILVLALSLPAVTLLACWGDSADRLAQMHPAVLATGQLLATLTAMMVPETAAEA